MPDSDWLCTFSEGETQGHLYVQATPISCTYRYSIDTTFETRAYLSIDGQIEQLEGASYVWGSYHHIDYLAFEWGGQSYQYGHSSVGSDQRICHPMDCAEVRDAATGVLLEDGCTPERTHPVACVPILADGTHAELNDDFVSCAAAECERAGGVVEATECCATVVDFPQECTAPDCSCAAGASREVLRCACPADTCYDRAYSPPRCRPVTTP